MHFTYWPSLTATDGTYTEVTWDTFATDFVRKPIEATDKNALEGFSLARFRDNRRAKHRVEEVGAVVLDIDDGSFDPSKFYDLAGVAYTSFSHTPEQPKWRVVLPVSRPMTAAEYACVWRWTASRMAARNVNLDAQTKDASRLWFIPAHKPGAPFECIDLRGDVPINVDEVLTMFTPEPHEQPALTAADVKCSVPPEWRIAQAQEYLARQPAAVAGAGGSAVTMRAIAGAARQFVLTNPDMILEAIGPWNARCEPPWEGAELAHKINEALHRSAIPWNTALDLQYLEASHKAANPEPIRDSQMASQQPAKPSALAPRWGDWDRVVPEPSYIVQGILPETAVGMFVAHGDSAKTWTAISLAAAVATGVPWLGRYDVSKGPALIADYESNDYEIRRRMRLLGVTNAPDLGYLEHPELRIDDPEFWLALYPLHLRLAIIDSLVAGALGVDENDTRAASPLTYAKRFAADTGAAVLFIHHRRKGDGDSRELVRGSTAFFAAVDCVYAFKPVDETDEKKRMRVECIKMRMGRKPLPINVELTDAGLKWFEDEARAIAHSKDTPDAIQQAILLAIADGPVETVEALAQLIGRQKARVCPELKKLLKRREVRDAKDRGYVLDSPEQRRARALEQLGARQWTTLSALAAAAEIETRDLKEMMADGTIVRSAEGAILYVEK